MKPLWSYHLHETQYSLNGPVTLTSRPRSPINLDLTVKVNHEQYQAKSYLDTYYMTMFGELNEILVELSLGNPIFLINIMTKLGELS